MSATPDSYASTVITDPDRDRYHTFSYISWWNQKTVSTATLMVVGAGALGNEVLKNLALMGIGRIFIVDFDTVERSNLSRSVLFRAEDEGQRKAEVAAARIKELNPDVAVQSFHGDLNYDLGLGVIRRMDAVIGCLDNRGARLSINRFCYVLNKAWVDGGILEMNGEARIFVPGSGACYECTLTDDDFAIINMRTSCPGLANLNILQGKVPTTPTISSIIAAVETQDALKLLHKLPVMAGSALVFHGLTNDVYTTQLPEKTDCQSHWIWDLASIVEVPEWSANSTTFRTVLNRARQELGDDAQLEFVEGMGRNFVLALHCRACNTRTAVYRAQHKFGADQAHCPRCGADCTPELTHVIDGDEGFLDQPLADLGIPPLHIIIARGMAGYRYYELTGDVETIMRFC